MSAFSLLLSVAAVFANETAALQSLVARQMIRVPGLNVRVISSAMVRRAERMTV